MVINLAKIAAVWTALPDAIRAGIVAMVKAAAGTQPIISSCRGWAGPWLTNG